MLAKQPPQLPLADAQPPGQGADAGLLIQAALGDQAQRPRDRVRSAAPGPLPRRRLRPAAQTGPKPGRLGRGGGGKEPTILRLGRAGRTDRTAIDPGRGDADKDPPVEPRVAGLQDAIAMGGVKRRHDGTIPRSTRRVSPFSDVIGWARPLEPSPHSSRGEGRVRGGADVQATPAKSHQAEPPLTLPSPHKNGARVPMCDGRQRDCAGLSRQLSRRPARQRGLLQSAGPRLRRAQNLRRVGEFRLFAHS